MPADPGNKADEPDLHGQYRAAVAGFGLCERELPNDVSRIATSIASSP